MKKSRLLSAVCTALCIISTSAHAGFMGNTVTAEWLFPDTSTVLETHDVNVTGGVELPSGANISDSIYDIDIGNDFILLSFNSVASWQDTSANGWQFSDTFGSIAEIIGFTIGATTGVVTELEASDLSFTGDSVLANFGAVNIAEAGSTIRLDVQFSPVPIPAAAWLFGSTLGLLGWMRRKTA